MNMMTGRRVKYKSDDFSKFDLSLWDETSCTDFGSKNQKMSVSKALDALKERETEF